jgi:hypothetical protein
MHLLVIFFFLTLAAAVAPAQMGECPEISIEGYKVILDNVNVLGTGTQPANLLLGRLRQKVQFDLTAIQLETTPQMVVVPCGHRSPKDVTDFNATTVDSLNSHRVLVEIWGQIEARSGISVQRAQLNFTLVPVSYYDRSAVPPEGFSAAYQQRLRGTPDDLVKLFGEFSELKAYVSITAGVKSLKEHDYDQAFLCFCRAHSLLERPLTGMKPTVRTSLLRYVDQKVSDDFTQAHADRSVKSGLGLDGTQPGCPGTLQ